MNLEHSPLGVRTSSSLNEQLWEAAEKGNSELVASLLSSGADGYSRGSFALVMAASYGHAGCVKLLIPVSNPMENNSIALLNAAKQGYVECVRLLIPVSDTQRNNSHVLCAAAENGHAECVKLLIPVSEPKDFYSYAIRLAASKGFIDCVKLLYPVSNIASARSEMCGQQCPNISILDMVTEEMKLKKGLVMSAEKTQKGL